VGPDRGVRRILNIFPHPTWVKEPLGTDPRKCLMEEARLAEEQARWLQVQGRTVGQGTGSEICEGVITATGPT
jgi:hypothetical protein